MTTTTPQIWKRATQRIALSEWQRSALVVLGLLLLPFVVFAPITLGRQIFFFHDVQYYFFPYHKLVVDDLRQGYLPLWNPYAFSGIPLLGDGQTAMFYPPNWLFFVLPTALALNYDILLQFSLAGAGMFLYLRRLGAGRSSALLAALAYMFNGFITTRVVHLSIMSGAAMIPWVFWGLEGLRRRLGWATFSSAALVVAMQTVAGHPQVPIYSAVGLGAYLLVRELVAAERSRAASVLRTLALLAAVYVTAYSLAAVQLFPWIDFARFSPRAAYARFEFVAGQSVVGVDWLLLLMPYIFGGVRMGLWSDHAPYVPQGIYIWERSAYLGMLPLALGVVALLAWPRGASAEARARRGAVLALGAVLLVGLLIAGSRDTFVAQVIYNTPVLGKLRAYSRAVILVAFALAALAGLGLQQLIDAGRTRRIERATRWALWVVAGGLVLTLALVALLGPILLQTRPPGWVARLLAAHLILARPNTYVPLILSASTAALLVWWSRRGARPLPLVALALVAVDMTVYAVGFNPTASPDVFETVPPSVQFLQRDTTFFRTATFLDDDKLDPMTARSQLAISWGLAFGIPSINGFNSLQPRRYTDLLFGPDVDDVSYGFLSNNRLLQPGDHRLSMLQARYVLVQPGVEVRAGPDFKRIYTDPSVTIYENKRVYPRAYFVSRVRSVSSQVEAFAALRSSAFNPRSEAVVEGGFDPGQIDRQTPSSSTSQATVEDLGPNRLRVTVETNSQRLLVLGEMYMPGWYAALDGRPVPIYRTNYLFRGIVVPAGKHTIELVYRPLSAIAGAALSLVTALLLIIPASIKRRRTGKRRMAGAGSPPHVDIAEQLVLGKVEGHAHANGGSRRTERVRGRSRHTSGAGDRR